MDKDFERVLRSHAKTPLAVFAVWLGSTNLARAGEGFALFRLDVGQQSHTMRSSCSFRNSE